MLHCEANEMYLYRMSPSWFFASAIRSTAVCVPMNHAFDLFEMVITILMRMPVNRNNRAHSLSPARSLLFDAVNFWGNRAVIASLHMHSWSAWQDIVCATQKIGLRKVLSDDVFFCWPQSTLYGDTQRKWMNTGKCVHWNSV